MAYKKNIWKRKDRITKEKLNHMEDGIYNAHNKISPLKYIEQDVKAMKFNTNSIDDLYLGVFFDSDNDTETFLYASTNGVNFERISNTPIGSYRDCDITFYNNKFYIFATQELGENISDFKVLVSDNLVSWKEYKINVGLRNDGNNKVWAPELFIDDDGRMYLILSKQIGEMTDTVTHQTLANLRPYIVDVVDLEKLQFNNPREIILDNTNKIDGHIIKKDGVYYLFIKKELNEGNKINGRIEIWKSADLVNWINITYGIQSFFNATFEAPCIEKVNEEYYLYCDNCGNEKESYFYYAKSTDLINWSEIKRVEANPITIRHGSVRKIKDYRAKQIIENVLTYSIICDDNNSLSLYNKQILLHENTSQILNKYIHLFTIKTITNYKSCSITFKLVDTQGMNMNIDYLLTVHRFTDENDISVTIKPLNTENPLFDINKVLAIKNGDTITVVYDVGNQANCTPVMSITSFSNFTFKLKINRAIYDTIPPGTIIKPTVIEKLRVKEFVAEENNTVTFKGYIRNGLIIIKGHPNTIDEFIYCGITVLNGQMKLFKLNDNSKEISMTYTLPESGKTDIYEITLDLGVQYSAINVELPELSFFY